VTQQLWALQKNDIAAGRNGNRVESIRVFPKIRVPQNGWFTMETPIKMDDLGIPLFLEPPIHEMFFFETRMV